MVRKASTQMHRCISQKELFLLYEDLMNGNDVFDDDVPQVTSRQEPVPEETQEQPDQ